MRNARLAALAIAAAAATTNAHAVTTYEFTFDGTSTHTFNPWECPAQSCDEQTASAEWFGTLTLTAPDGDGTFSPSQVALSITERGRALEPLSLPFFRAVIVDGGSVTSLDGTAFYVIPPLSYHFDGMSIALDDRGDDHHFGPTDGIAQLSPVSPAPEPEAWALLLAGLGWLGARGARARV